MKVCSFEGCGKKSHSKDLCGGHYQQMRRGVALKPLGVRRSSDKSLGVHLVENSSRVPGSGCIEWLRAKDADGYGRVHHRGQMRLVYRVAWELENGPIPKGMVIDHLCHNPACFNVEHLRLATVSENGLNRSEARSASGYRGVYLRNSGRYSAQTQYHAEIHYLGTFDTAEEAAAAVELFWNDRGIIYNSREEVTT